MDTLPILVTVTEDGDAVKGIFTMEPEAVLRDVPVGALKASLSVLCRTLLSALDEIPETNKMKLREMSIGVEITASGGVVLVGTASVGGKAAVTLKFGE